MQQSKLKWHHIINSGIKFLIKIRSIKVIISDCSVYKWLFSRQHFSPNIGSEVLRLQDFAQIILKFSWGWGVPPFHIGLGPVEFWRGQLFFLSRPLVCSLIKNSVSRSNHTPEIFISSARSNYSLQNCVSEFWYKISFICYVIQTKS